MIFASISDLLNWFGAVVTRNETVIGVQVCTFAF